MPATVIDSLITELRLDTTDFGEGYTRATDTLRRLEAQAGTSAENIQRTAGRSVTDYLAGFEKQFSQVNQHLTNISANSRRGGQAIRQGAEEATAGLSGLVTTALEAYATIKGLQGIYDGLVNTAANTAGAGRLAVLTGLPIEYFSAYAQYAHASANVPEDTTYGELNQFEQKRAAYRATGQYSEAFTALGRLAPGIDFNSPLQTLLPQLAKALAGQHGPEAEFWARELGLGNQVNVLRQGEGALRAGLEAHRYTAITKEQAESAEKLQTALNEFEIHMGKLWRVLVTNVNPQLEEFLTTLTGITDWMSDHVSLLLRILNILTLGVGGTSSVTLPGKDESNWDYIKRTTGNVFRSIYGGEQRAAPGAGSSSAVSPTPPSPGGGSQLADVITHVPGVDYTKSFHDYCAALVNKALVNVGLPPLPSNIATDASKYGAAVPINEARPGDLAIMMNGRQPGETGGHVGVITEVKRDAQGNVVAERVYSTDSEDAQGNVVPYAGYRWRHADYVRRPIGATIPPAQINYDTGGLLHANASIWSSVSNEDRSIANDVNATIHVYPNAGDGNVFGGHVSDPFRNRMRVNSSDVGLE